jgi:hypothetical protein
VPEFLTSDGAAQWRLEEVSHLKDGCIYVSLLDPFTERELIEAFVTEGISAISMEMIPRITRAQKVEAFDTRPVVEEQVKSLGARFVKIDLGETGQTKDWYAKALTDEQLQKQREGMAKVCAASDVVNPAAREVASSPIYGMPIIDADNAKTVLVLKRSMAAGFSGVDNPLFVKENTRMLFGDAKATVQQLVAEFKES